MARLALAETHIEVWRGSFILDTCVLVGAFHERDQYHQHASEFIGRDNGFLIPYVVLAETWGVLLLFASLM
jgi:predicted nucleic acid-binding protein